MNLQTMNYNESSCAPFSNYFTLVSWVKMLTLVLSVVLAKSYVQLVGFDWLLFVFLQKTIGANYNMGEGRG